MCIYINVVVSWFSLGFLVLFCFVFVKAFIHYLTLISPTAHINCHKNPLEIQEGKQTCFCTPQYFKPL